MQQWKKTSFWIRKPSKIRKAKKKIPDKIIEINTNLRNKLINIIEINEVSDNNTRESSQPADFIKLLAEIDTHCSVQRQDIEKMKPKNKNKNLRTM